MALEKEIARLYKPSATACEIVDVPEMRFLVIDGNGDPNTSRYFQGAIQALYGVSYTLKFMLKKSGDPRRAAPEKLKTVVRQPIRRIQA